MTWRGSSSRGERAITTPSPCERAAFHGSRRGQGLGDQLAWGPRRVPNNQNGISSASRGDPRPGGMLDPFHVCGRPSPDPMVPRDGLRPPLFRGGAGEPLFLLILRKLSGKLAWLSVALKTSVRLPMLRAHLFLLRAFVTVEDFRLLEPMSVILCALGELQPDGWASLMHGSTSPKPVPQTPNPAVAARGLGDIRTYHILDALWDEVVGEGVDVEQLASEFALEISPPPLALHRRETDPLVEPMLRFLRVMVLSRGWWGTQDGPPRAGPSLFQNHRRKFRSFST